MDISIYMVLPEKSWGPSSYGSSGSSRSILVVDYTTSTCTYQLGWVRTLSRFHLMLLTCSCNFVKLHSNLEYQTFIYNVFFLLLKGIFNLTSTYGYLYLHLFSNLRIAELGEVDSQLASCSRLK